MCSSPLLMVCWLVSMVIWPALLTVDLSSADDQKDGKRRCILKGKAAFPPPSFIISCRFPSHKEEGWGKVENKIFKWIIKILINYWWSRTWNIEDLCFESWRTVETEVFLLYRVTAFVKNNFCSITFQNWLQTDCLYAFQIWSWSKRLQIMY